MGKCGSCKFNGHCNTTSELYSVPKYNGGCQYYKEKNEVQGMKEQNYCDKCGYVIEQCECEKPQTNADRIRNMTDAELAEWVFRHDTITYCHGRLNTEELLQWLKSEAKE